jgi:hypothetical protein
MRYTHLRHAVLFAIAVLVTIAVVPLAVTGVELALLHLAAASSRSAVLTAGPALQIVVGFVTAPSTTLTAWTLAAGDSLQIANCDFTKVVRLLSMWSDQQTAGFLGVRSPKLHDAVRGIRVKSIAATVTPLLPLGTYQKLFPQDVLTVEQSGSATAGDIETGALLVHYEDLPGVSARFITYDELMKRGVNTKSVENTLALGTAGGYSGSVAINATEDLMKANTDYALAGYECDVECAAVGWKGPDTGNVRLGGPGNPSLKHLTGTWFVRLAREYGLPLIPIINSANKGATFIDGVQDENGADSVVSSHFIELAPR